MAEPHPTKIRVRFAPSPTGLLHIGGLRTALYNYLLARRDSGQFILRIEDTDRDRYFENAEDDIFEALEWSGLAYDEGPRVGGPHEPYYQSERSALYRLYATELVEGGHAYYAFDTMAELERMRSSETKEGEAPVKYDARTRKEMNNSLTLSQEDVRRRLDAGDEHVIRLKVSPDETLRFRDLIRGQVSIDSNTVDDQVLVKSDGMPTYHLASVVDDHLMGITHVVRGEEWLPSTPKHLLLYRNLGWKAPEFAHLPLILSPNGGKLSKRNSEDLGIPVNVRQYRAAGYEPEALINFLAFLGWNPGTEQEMFTLDELVHAFSIERIGSSGVRLDIDKLNWYNEQYVRNFSIHELVRRAKPYLKARGVAAETSYLTRVAELMQPRVSFARDLAETCAYFFEDPAHYDEEAVKKRWKDDTPGLLSAYSKRIDKLDEFKADTAEQELRGLADDHGVGAGRIIHPVRLALSGVSFGPSLFHMMEVIGKESCVRRIDRAVEVLG